MKIHVTKIHERAASRPEGYVEDVLSRGIVTGDWLDLPDAVYAELCAKYRPQEPPLPALPERAKNLAVQSAQEVAAIAKGVPAVTEGEAARRLSICKSNVCGFWRESDETCSQCGCPMAKKTPWRSARCPVNLW